MSLLDYLIIGIVAVLFIVAFVVYRKKPHCCSKCSGCCSNNCSNCKKSV